MKKYPEVCLHRTKVHDPNPHDRRAGHETHGPRTPHKVCRSGRCLPTGHRGVLPQEHFHVVPHFPHPGLRDRCNRQPELVPRNSRDHTQSCVQGGKAQQIFGYIRQPAHRYPLLYRVQSELHLSIMWPSLTLVKGYHLEHHKYLGEDGIDTDLPTRLELIILNNVFGKVFFA